MVLVIVIVIGNLPVIPTAGPCGLDVQNRSFFSDVVSFFECFGCVYSCPVMTVTLSFATLQAGSASYSDHQGAANLEISFNNPESATKIDSIQLTPNNATQPLLVYQCPAQNNCVPATGLVLKGNAVTIFNTTSTALYVSSNVTAEENVQYVFTFSNGDSVSGELVAQ
jgi:hypothetical protein